MDLVWAPSRLTMLSGSIQHFREAVLELLRRRGAIKLCMRKGVPRGASLDFVDSRQLLFSHLRETDKIHSA